MIPLPMQEDVSMYIFLLNSNRQALSQRALQIVGVAYPVQTLALLWPLRRHQSEGVERPSGMHKAPWASKQICALDVVFVFTSRADFLHAKFNIKAPAYGALPERGVDDGPGKRFAFF